MGLKRDAGQVRPGDEPLSDEPFVGLKLLLDRLDRVVEQPFRRTLCGVEARCRRMSHRQSDLSDEPFVGLKRQPAVELIDSVLLSDEPFVGLKLGIPDRLRPGRELSDEPFVGLKHQLDGVPTEAVVLSDEPFVGLKLATTVTRHLHGSAFRRTLCGVEAGGSGA